MDILGDRKFVEIPGDKTHQLPPLLIRGKPLVRNLDKVVAMAADILETEGVIEILPADKLAPDLEAERRRMDLAINLVEQYLAFVSHWRWGDSILEWIRQCEITCAARLELRHLLRGDIWPHAGRSSFVTLLEDKAVPAENIDLEKAVGLRLTFRQPPPISCFSNQFLFYLNGTLASAAYRAWAELTPPPVASLPPERFAFELVVM